MKMILVAYEGSVGRFMNGSVSDHLATNAKATVVSAR